MTLHYKKGIILNNFYTVIIVNINMTHIVIKLYLNIINDANLILSIKKDDKLFTLKL